jgi:hypothetical protein
MNCRSVHAREAVQVMISNLCGLGRSALKPLATAVKDLVAGRLLDAAAQFAVIRHGHDFGATEA